MSCFDCSLWAFALCLHSSKPRLHIPFSPGSNVARHRTTCRERSDLANRLFPSGSPVRAYALFDMFMYRFASQPSPFYSIYERTNSPCLLIPDFEERPTRSIHVFAPSHKVVGIKAMCCGDRSRSLRIDNELGKICITRKIAL